MTLEVRHLAVATALLAGVAGADAFGQAPPRGSQPQPQANAPGRQPERAVRTGKERLGQKWTDEQRVDDCGVPAARRGQQERPDCSEPAK